MYLLVGYEEVCLVSGEGGVSEEHRIEFDVGAPQVIEPGNLIKCR